MKKTDMKKPTEQVVDQENPEWTKEDFARAVPFSKLPERLQRALTERKRGEPNALKKVSISAKLCLATLFLLSPFGACHLSAQRHASDPCPLRIEIARDGQVFTNRFAGRYKTSMKLLGSDLKGGCYNDANPAAVSSVSLKINPGAPTSKVARLYRVLEQNGWPKSRVVIDR